MSAIVQRVHCECQHISLYIIDHYNQSLSSCELFYHLVVFATRFIVIGNALQCPVYAACCLLPRKVCQGTLV